MKTPGKAMRLAGGRRANGAMSKALPVIVVDYGGPGELATPECGFMLRMAKRVVLIPKLREAMERLVEDPDLCRPWGKRAAIGSSVNSRGMPRRSVSSRSTGPSWSPPTLRNDPGMSLARHAHRLGRELTFDAASEHFPDDREANTPLSREDSVRLEMPS